LAPLHRMWMVSLSKHGRVVSTSVKVQVLWLSHRGGRNRSPRVYRRLPTSKR